MFGKLFGKKKETEKPLKTMEIFDLLEIEVIKLMKLRSDMETMDYNISKSNLNNDTKIMILSLFKTQYGIIRDMMQTFANISKRLI